MPFCKNHIFFTIILYSEANIKQEGMSVMKGKWIIVIGSVLALLLIGSIGSFFFLSRIGVGNLNQGGMGSMMNSSNESSSDTMMGMENDGMGHATNIKLKNSTEKENPLGLPKVLKPDQEDKESMRYTVVAREGTTRFFANGDQTNTLGYNGNYLGPMIELKKGKTVSIRTINQLDEPTTFHWHGLVVPSQVEGGPHQIVNPGESKDVTFKVEQNESTLWFHPHPMGKTASQVYKGLAGLLYVKEVNLKTNLPQKYGKNDIPLILQNRQFNKENSMNYDDIEKSDGALGDTLVVNGTLNPYFDVKYSQIRVRLLNGSNARNYVVKLSDGASFEKIAGDGGYLSKPEKVRSVALSPGERTEILLDFSKHSIGEQVSLITDGVTITKFKLKEKQGRNSEITNAIQKMPKLNDADLKPDRRLTLFGMGKMVEINGKTFDENRIDIKVKQNRTETWEIYNKKDMMGGMIHPFHIHGVQFVVLERNGVQTNSQERGLKDTVAVKPGERVKIRMTFKQKGVFMYHCHILEHEENGMMGQLKVD